MTAFQQANNKPIPRSILIFGASDHIGGPLATFLGREAPSVQLRLASRHQDKVESLQAQFPLAQVVVADYTDLASLTRAVDGMEGIFVITPSRLDETLAMNNLVQACKASGTLVHMIRFMEQQPEASTRGIPPLFRQHHYGDCDIAIAKRILDHSGLPVTYVNSGATFMDNFMRLSFGTSVKRERTLVWPERLIPWIDPRDVVEVIGRLFLSDNHRHIGQFHTMNNGHDLKRFHEVADLLGDVIGEPVAYDSSREGFSTPTSSWASRR